MFGYFSSPDLRKGGKGEPVLLSSVSWNSELKAGCAYTETERDIQTIYSTGRLEPTDSLRGTMGEGG